jgi:hypothetical protein
MNSSSCLVIPHDRNVELDFWSKNDYTFMYSIEFFADERYRDFLGFYYKLVRTDTDVFLTPHIFKLEHELFVVGKGNYVHMEFTQNQLKGVAKKLGLRHQGIHNLGSTWFGKPEIVAKLSEATLWICKHFILDEFGPNVENSWSKWWRGVTLLYAAELAINDMLNASEFVSLRDRIDYESTSGAALDANGGIPHIHCWHTEERFSKIKFKDGLYTPDKFNETDLDITIVRDYCTWIAVFYSPRIV